MGFPSRIGQRPGVSDKTDSRTMKDTPRTARRLALSKAIGGDRWLSIAPRSHRAVATVRSSSRPRRAGCMRPGDASHASRVRPCTLRWRRLDCCLPWLPILPLHSTRSKPWVPWPVWVWTLALPEGQPLRPRPRPSLRRDPSMHRDRPSTSIRPCTLPWPHSLQPWPVPVPSPTLRW